MVRQFGNGPGLQDLRNIKICIPGYHQTGKSLLKLVKLLKEWKSEVGFINLTLVIHETRDTIIKARQFSFVGLGKS